MSKLKKYKFSELYSMSSGISSKPEQAGHGSPFLTFSDVFNNYFVPDTLTNLMDTSEKEQETYSVKKGDIFLTRTSETIDELGMSCVALKDYPNATYSGFVKRLRPLQDDITHENYMGFYLRSRFFRKTMTNNAVLTLRASLNEEIYSYLNLYLPDYKTQKSVGDFLLLLNAKIALNNRINAELEAMAKTLYDYWFVQFDFPNEENKPYKTSGGAMVWNEELKREIPEGWEVGELKSICNANQYQLNSSSNFSYVNYLDTSNITKNQIDNVILIDDLKNNLPSRAKRRVKKNDIIYSTVRPNQEHYGIIKEPVENMIVSTGFAVISHKKNTVLNDFIYCFLSNKITVDFLQTIADTSVSSYPSINVDDILNLKIALPKEDTLLIAISTQFSHFYQLIHKKQKENQQLSALRDWLLPMLMNGQVVVGEK